MIRKYNFSGVLVLLTIVPVRYNCDNDFFPPPNGLRCIPFGGAVMMVSVNNRRPVKSSSSVFF